MEMIQYIIYFHAFLGGIALISGLIAAVITKGSKWHKKMGATFHNTMLSSILVSLIIACLPGHFSPFLICIGLFSAYSVIAGKRCLKSLKPNFNIQFDRNLAYLFLVVGISMIILGFVLKGDMQIVLSVFGIFALMAVWIDLKNLKSLEFFQKKRILIHINKISGGYIAAATAFMVVNNFLPGIWNWFVPSVIGSSYTFYFSYLEKKKNKSLNDN